MHRNLLLAAWIAASLALVAAGACVRFVGPYAAVDQFLHAILFFFAALMTTVALVCSLPLLRRLPAEVRAGRFVAACLLAPVGAMAALLGLAIESDHAAEARHRATCSGRDGPSSPPSSGPAGCRTRSAPPSTARRSGPPT